MIRRRLKAVRRNTKLAPLAGKSPIGHNEGDFEYVAAFVRYRRVAIPAVRPESEGENPGPHSGRDVWEFRRLRTGRRRRFRDAGSYRAGVSRLLHANGIDRLCFAGWRR